MQLRRTPQSYPSLHYRYSHDIGNILSLRLFGFYAAAGVVRLNKRHLVYATATTAGPLLLGLAWLVIEQPPTGQALEYGGWLLYFWMLSGLAVAFSFGGVRLFHRLTPELEQMLTAGGRAEYDEWADLWTSMKLQTGFAAIFSIAACVSLGLAGTVKGIRDVIYVSPASYASVLVTSVVLAGCAYWIVAGTVLAIRLSNPGHLRLSAYAPSLTPGLDLLARCYRMAFYASCVGVSLCLIPILSWAYRVQDSELLTAIKFGLFLAAVSVTTAIAVVPQWRLSRIVSDERRRIIGEISSQLPASPSSLNTITDRQAFLVGWMQTVTASPSATVSESAVLGILLGGATAAVPFALQVLLGG